ncbi:MAG: hypothetical protein MJ051_01065 [Akkermansia sp.]|nr:hypothetical protein [Akkermansia sp.]
MDLLIRFNRSSAPIPKKSNSTELQSSLSDDKKLLSYQEALNQLRLHAPLIWRRNAFYTTLQAALFAYYLHNGAAKDVSDWSMQEHIIAVLIPPLALYISIAWFRTIKAGQKIQRQWRLLCVQIENEYFGDSVGPLSRANGLIGEGTKKDISITSIMINITKLFIVLWMALIAFRIFDYYRVYVSPQFPDKVFIPEQILPQNSVAKDKIESQVNCQHLR